MATERDHHDQRATDPAPPTDGRAPTAPGSRRWPAVLATLVGLALVVAFGLRGWTQWQYAQRVERGEIRVETLRGWMTLPYVARIHGVPEHELRAAIGAPATGHDERSLRQWFEATRTDPLVGRQALEAVIIERGTRGADPAPRP